MRLAFPFGLLFIGSFTVAGALSTNTLPRLQEEVLRFDPVAARLAVDDLAQDPSYDAPRHRAAVEALAAKRTWVLDHLNPTNEEGRAEAVALVLGFRRALLANPRLDCDRILCVRAALKIPSGQRPRSPAVPTIPTPSADFPANWGCSALTPTTTWTSTAPASRTTSP